MLRRFPISQLARVAQPQTQTQTQIRSTVPLGLTQAKRHYCMGNLLVMSYGIGAVVSGLSVGADVYKDITRNGAKSDYIFASVLAPAATLSGLLWPLWVPPYSISQYNLKQRQKQNMGCVTQK